MVYRTNADPTIEAARAEARELGEIARASAGRRRRVAIAITVVVAGIMSTCFALPALQPTRPRMICHNVELRWENAPHIPANTWRACRMVID